MQQSSFKLYYWECIYGFDGLKILRRCYKRTRYLWAGLDNNISLTNKTTLDNLVFIGCLLQNDWCSDIIFSRHSVPIMTSGYRRDIVNIDVQGIINDNNRDNPTSRKDKQEQN